MSYVPLTYYDAMIIMDQSLGKQVAASISYNKGHRADANVMNTLVASSALVEDIVRGMREGKAPRPNVHEYMRQLRLRDD